MQSNLLVGSSCTFLIPSLYAYRKRHYFYSSILTGTAICSINHWRRPENGFRRMIDIIYASFSFSVFSVLGVLSIRHKWYGYTGLFAIVYCYKMSHHLYQTKGPESNWYIYHLLFHLLMTTELMMIIRVVS